MLTQGFSPESKREGKLCGDKGSLRYESEVLWGRDKQDPRAGSLLFESTPKIYRSLERLIMKRKGDIRNQVQRWKRGENSTHAGH